MHATSLRPPVALVDTLLKLSRPLGPTALARSFRDAAIEFMNDSPHWTGAELAMWLMGPYTQCTRHISARAREDVPSPPPVLLREIDPRFIDRIIGTAHASVLDVLRSEIESGDIGAFADEMIEAGFVIRCEDAGGSTGWLPTTKPRRLAERVLSLLAADYLMRPAAFEQELSLCAACKIVEFDPLRQQRAICQRHQSGFFGGPPRSFFPEGA